MTSPNPASRTVILVAVDHTPASNDAVRTAALLAPLGQVELHLLHVIAPITAEGGGEGAAPVDVGPPIAKALESGRALLSEASARIRANFTGRIATHTAVGSPVQEILEVARDLKADVIVVGSHSRKMVERWVLGSVSEQVVRKASCAVIVARPKDYAKTEPEIEPPCPDCVVMQKKTDGDKLWCEQHSRRHVHGELHYEVPASFGIGLTFLRPEG